MGYCAQALRWGWTPAVRRVREQYRRAIGIHAVQRRLWDERLAALWRMLIMLPLTILAAIARVVTYPLALLSGNITWSQN